MRTALAAVVVVLFLTATGIGHAGEVKVRYRVELKALRAGVTATTPLAVQLFADSVCNVPATSVQTIAAGALAIIEQAKLVRLRGAAPSVAIAELECAVSAPAIKSPIYAVVTGNGIKAWPMSCQLQSDSTGLVLVDAGGATVGVKNSETATFPSQQVPVPTIAIATSAGVASVGVAREGFLAGDPVFFEGEHCLGQPWLPTGPSLSGLATESPSRAMGGSVTHTAAGFFISGSGTQLYVPSVYGTPNTISPLSYAVGVDATNCSASQAHFSPPSTCCLSSPTGVAAPLEALPAAIVDLQSFLPPFGFAVR